MKMPYAVSVQKTITTKLLTIKRAITLLRRRFKVILN